MTHENNHAMMARYPMAVKIDAREAESFPTERYLFIPDGRCVLHAEAWPQVMVKNGTVSMMRLSAYESLYYFPDYDDQKRYMSENGIVVKKEDLLPVVSPLDDIPF